MMRRGPNWGLMGGILFCVLFWTGCAATIGGVVTQFTATPFHPSNVQNGVVLVWDAPGGYMAAYRRDMAASLAAGYTIRVRGRCDSACVQIIDTEFRPYIRTRVNPDGPIDISGVFFVHQISDGFGPKNLNATRQYLAMFPQQVLDDSRIPSAELIGTRYYSIPWRVIRPFIEETQRGT
jgi:hypothetical protein